MLYVSMPAISLLAARGESTIRPIKRPQATEGVLKGYSRGYSRLLAATERNRPTNKSDLSMRALRGRPCVHAYALMGARYGD